MDLTKYDMTDIWAVAGDVVSPDSAKIRQGWGVEVVPRQWWNWFENRQDQNIAYMLQKGLPEWDATTEYIINKSHVVRSGIVYRATATSTGSDPLALTSWVRAFADYSVASNALGALTPAADRMPYFNGASTAALTTLTAFARSLLDDADAATMRTTINAQVQNQNLTSLSAVTPVSNGLPYFTGTTAMGITTLTSFGRSLIAANDAVSARTLLEVDSAATVASNLTAGLATRQPLSSTLTTLATLTPATNKLPYFTGASTVSTTDITPYARSFLDDADAATARATLEVDSAAATSAALTAGLATKQDLNSNLTAWTTLTPVANTLFYWTSGTAIASTALTSFARTLLSQNDALSVRITIGSDNASNLTSGTLPLARIPTNLTGVNAATATALQTPRTIQGVAFDGTANITLPVVPRDSATGAASMPAGDTSSRPSTPVAGMMRYNSDNQTFEGYQGGQWSTVGGAGLPVGSLVPWNVSEASIPFGWLPRSGGLYNRADYPDLWVLIQSLVVSDADWISTPANRGKYSSGNGTTTFRVPDDNGKYDANGFGAVTLRGHGKNSSGLLGIHQADAMQSWSASIAVPMRISEATDFGALSVNTPGTVKNAVQGDGTTGKQVVINPGVTARTASETRMTNTTVVWCTVAAGKVNNIGNIDINVINTNVNSLNTNVSTLNTTVASNTTQIADLSFGYSSASMAIVPGGVVTLNHGLGAPPQKFWIEATCTVADFGYAVGTVIRLNESIYSVAGNNYGCTVELTSTQIIVNVAATGYLIIRKDNKAIEKLTATSWTVKYKASKS